MTRSRKAVLRSQMIALAEELARLESRPFEVQQVRP